MGDALDSEDAWAYLVDLVSFLIAALCFYGIGIVVDVGVQKPQVWGEEGVVTLSDADAIATRSHLETPQLAGVPDSDRGGTIDTSRRRVRHLDGGIVLDTSRRTPQLRCDCCCNEQQQHGDALNCISETSSGKSRARRNAVEKVDGLFHKDPPTTYK